MLESVLRDLRFSFRSIARNRAFTAVAVITLALGIGANSAVFSVVDAVLLRPLPYAEPDRLTVIWTSFGRDLPQNWVSGPEFRELQELNRSFDEIGVVIPLTSSIIGVGEPEQVGTAAASGNFFDVLRVDAALGRTFTAEDDRATAQPTALLSHGYWQRRFGGDPGVVGRTLNIDGNPFTIVGVLPADFQILHPDAQFPPSVEVWFPAMPVARAVFGVDDYGTLPRGAHFLRAFARLSPGVSLEQARADLDGVAARMRELSPDYYDFEGWGLTVYSLHGDLVEEVKPALLVLLGAVAFVLLIACVNVANLMLARGAAREREMAVRSALGAGRGRLVRQLLTESVTLALLGGIAGFAMAFLLVRSLSAVLPADLPRAATIGVDPGILAFTLIVALAAGVLFGLAPALGAGKQDLVDSLKEGGRGATVGQRGRRLRSGLVIAEVALALVLLVGAGLMLRSFARLLDSNPGYDPDGVLTLAIPLPATASGDDERVVAFFDRLLERVESLPSVSATGAISHLPLSGTYSSGTTQVDWSAVLPEEQWAIEADRRSVSPDYFRAMGIQIVRGRAFTAADRGDAPLVAIVDARFARRFWPNEDPIGKHVSVDFGESGPAWREVVGVIAHPKHYTLSSEGREQVYFPYQQRPASQMYLAIRTPTSDPAALAGAVRREVWALDPNQPVDDVETMNARVAASLSGDRFNLLLLGGFAALALLMAAVGIYGVISYTVAQRSHEFGIRMALGADRGRVLSLVLRQGLRQALSGVLLGAAAALALTRLMVSLLFEVRPADPVTYVAVAALLVAVAVLASGIPALRAARYQPVEVLREE
jgi:putative ABC transport system permease protein